MKLFFVDGNGDDIFDALLCKEESIDCEVKLVYDPKHMKRAKELIKTITDQKHASLAKTWCWLVIWKMRILNEKMVSDMEDENSERVQSKNRETDR